MLREGWWKLKNSADHLLITKEGGEFFYTLPDASPIRVSSIAKKIILSDWVFVGEKQEQCFNPSEEEISSVIRKVRSMSSRFEKRKHHVY